MSRRLPVAIASAAAALGLVFVGATPASAADVPPDNQIYVIGGSTLWTSDSTGALTEVGSFSVSLLEVYGADWDPTSGLAYFFNDDSPCALYSLDITTGAETFVGNLEADNCDGIDIDMTGVLRVLDGDGVLYTVDKTTAATISELDVTGTSGELAFLAQAPDGTFEIGNYTSDLYALNVTTGAATPNAGFPYIESADFDTSGRLWMVGDGVECSSGLASAIVSIGESYVFQGDLMDGESCSGDVFAIFVTGIAAPPAPVLPATGPTSALALTGIAGLAILAGLIVLVRSRRTA